jgi:hypothetical protein
VSAPQEIGDSVVVCDPARRSDCRSSRVA